MTAQPQTTETDAARPAPVLRLGDPKEPKTPKGFRTQAKIMVAARTVMARDGFLNSRIQDVAAEAGCALGTVYTYFDDKSDLLGALLEEVFPELMEVSRRALHRGDAAAVLYGIVHDYLAVYRRHRELFELLAEATATDERFRAYWFTVRGEFVVTMVRGFETARKAGELDLPGDPCCGPRPSAAWSTTSPPSGSGWAESATTGSRSGMRSRWRRRPSCSPGSRSEACSSRICRTGSSRTWPAAPRKPRRSPPDASAPRSRGRAEPGRD